MHQVKNFRSLVSSKGLPSGSKKKLRVSSHQDVRETFKTDQQEIYLDVTSARWSENNSITNGNFLVSILFHTSKSLSLWMYELHVEKAGECTSRNVGSRKSRRLIILGSFHRTLTWNFELKTDSTKPEFL